MRFNLAYLCVLLDAASLLVHGHPGDDHDERHLSSAQKREILAEAEERNHQIRACEPQIAEFVAHRRRKREEAALKKRFLGVTGYTTGFATATMSASQPKVTAPRTGATCVLAPDVTEGPYYILNTFVRDDLTEWQPGVKMELDIGVVDVQGCTPVPNAFVELWGTNATGQYTGFARDNLPGGPGAPGPGQTPRMSDGDTSLRGGYPTNSRGVVGITTLWPGFYTGRTVHVHIMVHTNWTASTNGTIISRGGTPRHMGQIYFDDTWNDRVFNTTYYRRNTFNTRTRNNADFLLRQANAGGYNPYASVELTGSTLEEGVLAYITIGINSRKSLRITSNAYAGTIPRPAPPAVPRSLEESDEL